jgi:hypothetical protein
MTSDSNSLMTQVAKVNGEFTSKVMTLNFEFINNLVITHILISPKLSRSIQSH